MLLSKLMEKQNVTYRKISKLIESDQILTKNKQLIEQLISDIQQKSDRNSNPNIQSFHLTALYFFLPSSIAIFRVQIYVIC